jgi:hypothetical protein
MFHVKRVQADRRRVPFVPFEVQPAEQAGRALWASIPAVVRSTLERPGSATGRRSASRERRTGSRIGLRSHRESFVEHITCAVARRRQGNTASRPRGLNFFGLASAGVGFASEWRGARCRRRASRAHAALRPWSLARRCVGNPRRPGGTLRPSALIGLRARLPVAGRALRPRRTRRAAAQMGCPGHVFWLERKPALDGHSHP